MADDTGDGKLGLAGAPTFFPANVLGNGDHQADTTLIADLVTLEQLRLSIDRLADRLPKKPEQDELLAVNRTSIVELLSCLHTSLTASLARKASDAADPVVLFDHPAMVLLDELIGTLKDLDNAKTHPLFDTPKISKGASLSTAEARRRDALLELVDIIKLSKGLPTRTAAEKWIAQEMRKKVGRARAITEKQFKEMRKTRRRQQRRTS